MFGFDNGHHLEENRIGKDMALGDPKHTCNGLYDGSKAARYQEDLASSALQALHKLRNACEAGVCKSIVAGN